VVIGVLGVAVGESALGITGTHGWAWLPWLLAGLGVTAGGWIGAHEAT
jgi:hypothetical protein